MVKLGERRCSQFEGVPSIAIGAKGVSLHYHSLLRMLAALYGILLHSAIILVCICVRLVVSIPT